MPRNTLNEGLTAYYTFAEGAPPYKNLCHISENPLALFFGTTPASSPGLVGPGMDTNAASAAVRTASNDGMVLPAGTTEFSAYCLVNFTTPPASNQHLFQCTTQFNVVVLATGAIFTTINPGSGFVSFGSTATPASVPGTFLFGISWDGTTLTQRVDTVTETDPLAASGGLPANTDLKVGNNSDTPGNPFRGRYDWLGIWDRALTDAEYQNLLTMKDVTIAPTVRQSRSAVNLIRRRFPGILAVCRGQNEIEILDKRPDNRANAPILPNPNLKTLTWGEARISLSTDPLVLPAVPPPF